MEVDQRMALEPAVLFGFVGIKVVQHYMNLAARMLADDLVEEVEELTPSAAIVVSCLHLSCNDVERGEQGGGAVSLIAVAKPFMARPSGSLIHPCARSRA